MIKGTLQKLKEIDYLISYCTEMQDDLWKLYEADKSLKEEFQSKYDKVQDLKVQLYAKKGPLLEKLFLDYNIIIA